MADIDTQNVAVIGMFSAVLVTVLAPASTSLAANFNYTSLDERPNCQQIVGSYVAAEVESAEEFLEFGGLSGGASVTAPTGGPFLGVYLYGSNTSGAFISQTFDEYSVRSGRGPLEAVNITAATGPAWEDNITVQYRTTLNVFKEVTLPHNLSVDDGPVRVSASGIDGNYLPIYMRIKLERDSGTTPSPFVDTLEVIHAGYDPGILTTVNCYTDTATSYATAILTLDVGSGGATLLHEVLRVSFGVMSIIVIITVAKLLSIVLPVIG